MHHVDAEYIWKQQGVFTDSLPKHILSDNYGSSLPTATPPRVSVEWANAINQRRCGNQQLPDKITTLYNDVLGDTVSTSICRPIW